MSPTASRKPTLAHLTHVLRDKACSTTWHNEPCMLDTKSLLSATRRDWSQLVGISGSLTNIVHLTVSACVPVFMSDGLRLNLPQKDAVKNEYGCRSFVGHILWTKCKFDVVPLERHLFGRPFATLLFFGKVTRYV